MEVIDVCGDKRNYEYAKIGDLLVPLVPGTMLEHLFFRVVHTGVVKSVQLKDNHEMVTFSADTRGKVRYESPEAYFKQFMKSSKPIVQWGDDSDDEKIGSITRRAYKAIKEDFEKKKSYYIIKYFEKMDPVALQSLDTASTSISLIP